MKNHVSQIANWLVTGNTGLSSEAIAATILGADVDLVRKNRATPRDPYDFCRCLKLLEAVPYCRENLHKMREVSDKWDTLVLNWDKVEAQFMVEVPGWLKGEDFDKHAPLTYKLMKEIGV